VRTFITVDRGGERRMYVLGGENNALAVSSPDEVDWKKVEENELVYVGEVFVEIAELITSFAKSSGKTVVYRPSPTIVAFDPERVRNVLRSVDVLILSKRSWDILKARSDSTPIDLIREGPKIIVITKGAEGCVTYTRDENFTTAAYAVEAIDSTGAGDAFAAGFISALIDSKGLRECIRYALAVSAIKVTGKGTRTALPTRSEVKKFMKKRCC